MNDAADDMPHDETLDEATATAPTLGLHDVQVSPSSPPPMGKLHSATKVFKTVSAQAVNGALDVPAATLSHARKAAEIATNVATVSAPNAVRHATVSAANVATVRAPNAVRHVAVSATNVATVSAPNAIRNAAVSATNVATVSTPNAVRTVAMCASSAATASATTAITAVSNIPSTTRNIVETISELPGEVWTPIAATPRNLRTMFRANEIVEEDYSTDFQLLSPPKEGLSAKTALCDFRQRLEFLLSTEDTAKEVAHKLYPRFNGEADKLDAVLNLFNHKWGFPAQVFPALHKEIRRASGQADDPSHITEEEWAEAFLKWLQDVRATSALTKVSRKCLVHARPGSFLAEEYLQGAKLGEGSFGEVSLMLHKALGVARVVKSVPKTQLGMAAENVEDEVDLLKSMDHPNIVRIFETFESELDLHIVMDYAEGGDLASLMKQAQRTEEPLKLPWVRSATGQIVSALEYMHKRAVIHCDLKPANCMLLRPLVQEDDMPHVLLADFGLAEIFQERPDQGAVKVKGSPAYLSPEGFEGYLTQKSDMWALGIMLYELLVGSKPFKEHSNVFVLWSQIAKQEPKLESLSNPVAHAAVKALLAKDPKIRPSAKDCRAFEWFQCSENPTLSGNRQMPLGHLNYFHRASMFCIASGLGMKDMAELYRIFQTIDTDRSGYLTLEELQVGLKVLGVSEDASTLMTIMDMDQNGSISYTEFMAAALSIEADLNDNLMKYAFEMFDLDGDGYISAHELQRMLSGDGPLVEVLPDGQTIEQVMNSLAPGSNRITFEEFRDYLRRDLTTFSPKPTSADIDADSPRFLKIDDVNQVIGELDIDFATSSQEPANKNYERTLPVFEKWLADMSKDMQNSTNLNNLLMFVDGRAEGLYVAHELPNTCSQTALMAFLLTVYSAASLLFSDWEWSPTIASWSNSVLVAHNCAWLYLALSGAVVSLLCAVSARRRRKASLRADDEGAFHFENWLCMWACFIPWVSCFFAERYRVAALFNREAADVFPSMDRWIYSDYDLIIMIFLMLAFFVTRTNMRFARLLCIGLSSVLAYLISAVIIFADRRGTDNHSRRAGDVIWPCIFILLLTLLVLSGHRAIEYHRRLTFLSLYNSYIALQELQVDAPDTMELLHSRPQTTSTFPAFGTQWERFKAALDLIQRFSDNKELSSRPLRLALRSLKVVLEEVRDDIAGANRWVSLDFRESLQAQTNAGLAQDALFAAFEVGDHDVSRVTVRAVGAADAEEVERKVSSVAFEEWGWDTMSGMDSPLFAAAMDIWLPALKQLGPEAEYRGQSCLECILRAYSRSPRSAEARAALTVRSAHWLAQAVGLWSELDAWEQVALLVSSAALHCHGGGGAVSNESMLTRVSCTGFLLDLLDKVGLVLDVNASAFRQLVCRILIRATPRKMLEDAHFIRCQVNQSGCLPASAAERKVIISLVVAAADFSFLALPTELHQPWAATCRAELATSMASKVEAGAQVLDVSSWLHALIKVLMVPVFDTLSVLDGAGENLEKPRKCLSDNGKMWKNSKLLIEVSRLSQVSRKPGQHLAEVEGVTCPESANLVDDLLPGQVCG